MMKHLSNDELITKTKNLVAYERRIGTEVLRHLHEIERRSIFLERGYASLFEFAVKELGYSEGAADRRVRSMRFMSTLPADASRQVEDDLKSGSLNLSSLSTAQRFFREEMKLRQKKYIPEEQMAVLDEIKHKSKSETEKVLARISPESQKTRISIAVDEALLEKLTRLKEVFSHQLPAQDMNALLHRLADMALKDTQKPTKALHSTPPAESPKAPRSDNPRHTPTKLRAAAFAKAQNQCQYKDEKTGRRCTARQYLQIDHITPVAHGGSAAPANLRVLCAAHNRHVAQNHGLIPPLI
jgi:hypothetical protein